ncbi:MAG: lamin tail domain-containing protein [Bacteroidetes bacterium]|nr:lamin tail domain-containing protein [Bacteroidota bacterium]
MFLFFGRAAILLVASLISLAFPTFSQTQTQGFQAPFTIQSYPEPFLPGWYANDLRATSSRVFRLATGGINGSVALAVQPISTFKGKLWVRLSPKGMTHPRVVFWAKTLKNGTGTRPALVHISWSSSLEGNYQERMLLGHAAQFPNTNLNFSRFELELPAALASLEEVYLQLEIAVGSGTGSAARWVIDDFSLEDLVVDEQVPMVSVVKGYGKREVLLAFSEPMDPVFARLNLAYQIDWKNPVEARLLLDSVVILRLEGDLEENRDYALFLQQLPDLNGNFLLDTLLKFRYTDPSGLGPKSLVINEVMPAPRADKDLPFVEYVELMNPLNKELRLSGVVFSSNSSVTVLPEYWISPGEFVLICVASQAPLLSEFGRVLPLPSFPSLSNSGSLLRLLTAEGQEIDRLEYRSSSWGGSEFADGGYSLELPDPYFRCEASEFLLPCKDPSRGTPGRQNSRFSPITNLGDLAVVSAFFKTPIQLFLRFNQPIVPWSSPFPFSFFPALVMDSSWVFSFGRSVEISLANPAQSSRVYSLIASSLVRCVGEPAGFEVEVILAEPALKGELILNEVLVDPRSGDPKFVEIHNTTSAKYLSLESWALTGLNELGAPHQRRIFGGEGDMLAPQEYLSLTVDPDRLRLSYPQSDAGNFLQVASLPSMPIGGGEVLLLSPERKVVDSLPYRADWHHPLLRSTKGVSLERISSSFPTHNPSTWQSASSSQDYATPGRKNSTALPADLGAELITLVPLVFDPGGSSGPSQVSIRYSMEQSGWVGSFIIYSAAGREVAVLGQNQILGTSGIFSWPGTDSAGSRVSPGYYVLVAQLFDLSGRVKVVKKILVVASPL